MRDLIVFAVAFFAAAFSSMCGGGAGIILFPAFLWMGMSYPLVAAISSVNSVGWVLPATRNYLKGRKIHRFLIAGCSLIGAIGSFVGVLLITKVNQRILEICVGALILVLAAYTYFRKGFGSIRSASHSRMRQSITYPAAFFLGIYETVFGSGNGIMFSGLTCWTQGFDFIEGLGHYYAVSFSWALVAAILLVERGYYDIHVMILAVSGSVFGAHLGSRYAKAKGNRFIRVLFVFIGGALGLKMVLGL